MPPRRLVALLAASATLVLLPASPAHAAAPTDVEYSPEHPPLGGAITVTGQGCAPGEPVGIRVIFTGSRAVLGNSYTTTADGAGAFSQAANLPAAPPPFNEFGVSATCGGTPDTSPADTTIVYGTYAEPPTIVNESRMTVPGLPVDIDVLANDTGSGLTLGTVSIPAQGTTSVAGEIVTYTPTGAPPYTDTFTYDVNGTAGPGVGRVSVNVLALTTSATTPSGIPVTIDVLDPALSGIVSITAVAPAMHGTANPTTLFGTAVRYEPEPGFEGTDTFDVTYSGGGHTATTTVTVTVTAAAAAPDDSSPTSNGTLPDVGGPGPLGLVIAAALTVGGAVVLRSGRAR